MADRHNPLFLALEQALGVRCTSTRPLSGGCIGDVYAITLEDGREAVAKYASGAGATLDIEGSMLQFLRAKSSLPVPEVFHSSPTLLVMQRLPGASQFNEKAEEHAAELLAALHGVAGRAFGFERDTLIGSLRQPNPWMENWTAFFAEHRLLYMADEALRAGRLPAAVHKRLTRLAGKLDTLLAPPDAPALLHGDVWTTNVLASGGKITGFLDPAIYFGHPEIELAFITLFDTFGEAFFGHYHALRGIQPGFFEERRDLYNLYPLLVHVRLFGGGYVPPIERTLNRFGL